MSLTDYFFPDYNNLWLKKYFIYSYMDVIYGVLDLL